MDLISYSESITKLIENSVAFVSITLVDIRGSAPQIVGAKMIVSSDGLQAGTVGGGKIEAATIAHAQKLLTQDGCTSDFVVWNLQSDIGMTCGGEVKLFFEVCQSKAWSIAVFGAGHISQSLVPILLGLQCQVTCIDPRADWLAMFPIHRRLTTRCISDMPAAVNAMRADTYFVLMTRGHATDLPILTEILTTRQAPFVGVIGSKQKASVLRRDLQTLQISDEKIASFHCPLGLDIGNNTPPEIAISVVAQLLQQRDRVLLTS